MSSMSKSTQLEVNATLMFQQAKISLLKEFRVFDPMSASTFSVDDRISKNSTLVVFRLGTTTSNQSTMWRIHMVGVGKGSFHPMLIRYPS